MAETETKRVRMTRTLAGPSVAYHAGQDYDLEPALADALVADGRATEAPADPEAERAAREQAEADRDAATERAEKAERELAERVAQAERKASQKDKAPKGGPAGGSEKRG